MRFRVAMRQIIVRRLFALVAAAFVSVPCAAAPRCDNHAYFEGCPVDLQALGDVMRDRCPAIDPDFARKLEVFEQSTARKRSTDEKEALQIRESNEREELEIRKSREYPAALREAEDWFDGLDAAKKKEWCGVR